MGGGGLWVGCGWGAGISEFFSGWGAVAGVSGFFYYESNFIKKMGRGGGEEE